MAPKIGELHEREHLLGAASPLGLAHAHDLERELDVGLDRPPVEEDGCLEDHPVVAVSPGVACGLAVDLNPARSRLDEVTDDPQQRAFPTAGWSDQAHELAGTDIQADAGQGRSRCAAGAESFLDIVEIDDRIRVARRHQIGLRARRRCDRGARPSPQAAPRRRTRCRALRPRSR